MIEDGNAFFGRSAVMSWLREVVAGHFIQHSREPFGTRAGIGGEQYGLHQGHQAL